MPAMPATLEIATICPPPAPTMRQKLLGQRDRREQIDTDDLLIYRKIGPDRKAALRDSGVVDQTVDPSAPVPGFLLHAGQRVIIGRLEGQNHIAGADIDRQSVV